MNERRWAVSVEARTFALIVLALVSTGVFGLSIPLALCFCALTPVWSGARRHDPLGCLTFLLLGFYVLQNLTSSVFTEFYEITLIVVLAVPRLLASRPPPVGRSIPRRSRSRWGNVSLRYADRSVLRWDARKAQTSLTGCFRTS